MKFLSLQEHIKQSKIAAKANKVKGNRHAEILSGLYNSPGRFIDEILQNTEDAYRRSKYFHDQFKKIKFILYENRLEILHHGAEFDENDLKSITTFANTTKIGFDDVNMIGKFGIGFKSVFSITQSPEIHSGGYHYKIVDFEVLEDAIKIEPYKNFSTLIILPFKKNEQENIYKIVWNALLDISAYSLLFLHYLNKIEIKIIRDNFEKVLIKSTSISSQKFQKIEIQSTNDNNSEIKRFYLFKNKEKPELDLQIAYPINNNDQLKAGKDFPVFVSFPTLQNSKLNFLINASFTTTPTREYIPFDLLKTPENIIILKNLVALFVKNLSELKSFNKLTLEFLSHLPIASLPHTDIKQQSDILYDSFYNAYRDELRKNKLIPVRNNKYKEAKLVAIPAHPDLVELIDENDLYKLFGKKYWIDGFPDCINEIFANFLEKEIGVLKIDFKKYAFHIFLHSGYLEKKTSKWLMKFYKIIARHQYLWSEENKRQYYSLFNKPFIKLADNSFASPDNKENNVIVISPLKNDKYRSVNYYFTRDKEILEFLNDLGIKQKKPYLKILDKLLARYNNPNPSVTKKQNQVDISNLSGIFSQSSFNERIYIIHKIKNLYIFAALNFRSFYKSSEIYYYIKKEFKPLLGQESVPVLDKYIIDIFEKSLGGINEVFQFFNEIGLKQIELEKNNEIPDGTIKNKFENFVPEVDPMEISPLYEVFRTETPVIIETNLSNINTIGQLNFSNSIQPFLNASNEVLKNWIKKFVNNYIAKYVLSEEINIDQNQSSNSELVILRNNELYMHIYMVSADVHYNYSLDYKSWRKISELFFMDKGNLTWIYAVKNPGKPYAKIISLQNPFQLWIDGKLRNVEIQFSLF